MKPYKGSKYAIIKDVYWADPSCCDHELCWKFHTKGCPEVRRVDWLIINIETGDRAFNGEAYELRRDAVSHLDFQLAQEEKAKEVK
jgi:hypothetical protein